MTGLRMDKDMMSGLRMDKEQPSTEKPSKKKANNDKAKRNEFRFPPTSDTPMSGSDTGKSLDGGVAGGVVKSSGKLRRSSSIHNESSKGQLQSSTSGERSDSQMGVVARVRGSGDDEGSNESPMHSNESLNSKGNKIRIRRYVTQPDDDIYSIELADKESGNAGARRRSMSRDRNQQNLQQQGQNQQNQQVLVVGTSKSLTNFERQESFHSGRNQNMCVLLLRKIIYTL